MRRRTAAPVALVALAGAVSLAGCGGGARQDANETSGTFPVAIVRASFPTVQSIGGKSRLVLLVRNTGTQTIPNLAITVNGLTYRSTQPGLADPVRPTFIINNGPGLYSRVPVQGTGAYNEGGYITAYVNTWASGPLAAGHTASFVWAVTPVQAGLHHITYTVAAGLNGKAKAQLANGAVPTGHFVVFTASTPPPTHVDPNTGQVVAGPAPNAVGVAAKNYQRAVR